MSETGSEISSDVPSTHSFTFAVAVCFTLNYIIGTGFLTLPWAFRQTGFVLGSLVLLVFTGFSIASVIFILEAISRAEDLMKNTFRNSESVSVSELHAGYSSLEMTSRSVGDNDLESEDDKLPIEDVTTKVHQVGSTKYELTELCELFMGKFGRYAYTGTIAVYMYGTLWAYSSVFAKAFASHLSIGQYSYEFYLMIFALIVVPASMFELSEQIPVQVALSIFRIVMVVLMVSTIYFAENVGYSSFGDFSGSDESSNLFNLDKVYLLLPVAAYANIFHHSIPSLSQPVYDKSKLSGIFSSALVISMVAYILIAVSIATYFGSDTKISSNLNWQNYHAHLIANEQTPFYAKAISFFVVLFPALDVASAFPLNAVTLGNNLMSSFYSNQTHLMEKSRHQRSIFRLLASAPPIFAAYFVSNLGVITDYAGLTGFGVALIFPGLLAYFSEKKLREIGYSTITVYSRPFLSTLAQFATVFLGFVMLIYVFSSLLIIGPPPSD